MKITESKLRKIIRQVIKENEGFNSFSFTDYLDGGVMQAFLESDMGASARRVQKDLVSDLHYQEANGHTGEVSTNNAMTNTERSGLTLNNLNEYISIDEGVYYVTPTGVWCCPLIKGNVNTSNACNQFAAFLRTIGFVSKGSPSLSRG